MSLANRVEAARQRSLSWFDAQRISFEGASLWRESAHHDPGLWPGMVLPGTYNSAMCLRLIGGLDTFDVSSAAQWIIVKRQADGSWWLDGMDPGDVFKKPDHEESVRYVSWHITNYTLGALHALVGNAPSPNFAKPYFDPQALGHWLSRRNMRDAWQEGNNIVNLGSFFWLLREDSAAGAALEQMMEWHDLNSEPSTGFWGVHQSNPTRLLHAMAGATHNYHLFYALNRPIPYHERAVDYCLTQPPQVVSACIDADLIDILAHAYVRLDYRREDIAAWLATICEAILAIQNEDGGFPDLSSAEGKRGFDGWRGGYSEPQGISCGFGTFFRWIAIAMCARVLEPTLRDWQFRTMPGLGYFNVGDTVSGEA